MTADVPAPEVMAAKMAEQGEGQDVTLEDFQQLQRQHGLLLQYLQDTGVELPPELEEELGGEDGGELDDEPLDEGVASILEAIDTQGLDTQQVFTLSKILIGGIVADVEQSLMDAITVAEDGLEAVVSQDDLKDIAVMADTSARLATALDILREARLPEFEFEDDLDDCNLL